MKRIISNLGYFINEARRIIKSNGLSNVFTFLRTVLILILLASVVTGWSIASRLVQMLEQEAEISAFFNDDMEQNDVLVLIKNIEKLDGVLSARVVDESEAYGRMKEILADDADILELFEDNPFKAYIEIRIMPEQSNLIVEKVANIQQIDYIRDNRDVLERINSIIKGMDTMGYLIIVAVVITTVIIISHMIRQGVYNNREQIKTLRLLGAPPMFIGFPFICVGLLITIGSGIVSSLTIALVIRSGYQLLSGSIPFIPLPAEGSLVLGVAIVIMGVSVFLGMIGSLFGLSSIKEY